MKSFAKRLFWLGVVLTLAACAPRLLPSRAFVIDLESGSISSAKAVSVLEQTLQHEGFKDTGPDGYDELTGQDTITEFKRDSILVSIARDDPAIVLVRVSDRAENFGPEAIRVFEILQRDISEIAPQSVHPQR